MKIVINGRSCDTNTALLIVKLEKFELYINRFGMYFTFNIAESHISQISKQEALLVIESNSDLVSGYEEFGSDYMFMTEFPITIRLPEFLNVARKKSAEIVGCSNNVWMIRAIQSYLKIQEGETALK
jgi:hypothetical protein